MQLSKGTLLRNGKYRIENVLGQGGFGITYLARQEILEREVCIKEFFMRDFCNRSETNSSVTLGTTANKELMERYLNKFIKEARTIAALEHPNIIHIHDIFKENDTAYYVMDYIEGESLAEMVKRRGPLPEEEAVAYIRSIADALKYVHERSINHLDVKPGNIMVRRADSRVFLLDFGLSKQYDTTGNQTSSTPLGISHGFAPIEQYSPEGIKEFSPQTDIYSLGATLYYLITGATPPPASELFASELEGFPSTISASVKEAVGQAMKPQKKERPQSVNDFLKLLPQSGQPESSVQTAFQESEKTEQTTSAAEEETSLLQDVKTPDQQDMVKDEPQNIGNQQLYDFEVEEPRRKRTKIIAWSVGIVALVFICFQLFRSSPQDLYKEGKQACENENYAAAFPLLEKAAEKGHAEAQYELSKLYFGGLGVTQDFTKAAKWTQKAAEQGVVMAQSFLGFLYISGQGVKQNYVEAVEWFQKASEQGGAYAQCCLGYIYENGLGVTQDNSEAVKWYQKAAEQGYADAQCCLGVMYENGKGIKKDYQQALKWYRMAAEQNDARAQCNLGRLYEEGNWVTKNLELAVEWYRKAAKQEYPGGLCALGLMYEFGKGVKQDYDQAIKLYRKAADQGDAWGQRLIGICYEEGIGGIRDYSTASEWYKKSAEQGDATSQRLLGHLYEEGFGVPQNYTTALEWYKKSAGQGDVLGQYAVGYMYESGRGVPKSRSEAIKWYKMAWEQGYEPAKEAIQQLENSSQAQQSYIMNNDIPQSYTTKKEVQQSYTTRNDNIREESSSYKNSTNDLNKDINIWNPIVASTTKENKGLRIVRVQVTLARTTIDLEFDNSVERSGWISISPDTYIISYNTGKKYKLVKVEGDIAIAPLKHYLHSVNSKARFRLIFPALPKNTTQFNLIEKSNSPWQFYGIQLSK